MRDRNKKTFTIVALVVAILLIGIGYAALQQSLVINGTAGIGDANWNIKITGIEAKNLNGAAMATVDSGTNPSFTDTSATFNVELQYPGASAEFEVTISNLGTIPAKLNSITGVDTANTATPTEIQYEVTGVTAGTTELAAETGTNVAKVKVTWVSNGEESDTVPTDTSKTATITLNYVQNTSTSE